MAISKQDLSTGLDQQVFVTTGGGEFKLFEVEVMDGQFNRAIDATSQAWVRAKISERCCNDIQYIRVWSTELEWYRDGSLVWAGPIRQVNYDNDEIQIIASDISAWWDFRPMPRYANEGDVAKLFTEIIERGTEAYPIPGMKIISSSVGRRSKIDVIAEDGVNINSVLQQLSDSDIDWTVVGRNVLVYNPALQVGVNEALLTLADDCWNIPPRVVQRGDGEFATSIVATGGANLSTTITAPEIIIEQYGFIQKTVDFPFITDQTQLQRAAESWLSFLIQPFYITGTGSARLIPGKAAHFDTLLPGLLVNTQINHLCLDFVATMRIQNVQNFINGDVKIGLEPIGSTL